MIRIYGVVYNRYFIDAIRMVYDSCEYKITVIITVIFKSLVATNDRRSAHDSKRFCRSI